MAKNIDQQLTSKELEKILARQTDVILSVISEKLIRVEKSIKKEIIKKLTNVEKSIEKEIRKRLINMEESFNKGILKMEKKIDRHLYREKVIKEKI